MRCQRQSAKIYRLQANKGRLLAVADEEGYVAVVNTSKDLPLTTWPEPDNQEQVPIRASGRTGAAAIVPGPYAPHHTSFECVA